MLWPRTQVTLQAAPRGRRRWRTLALVCFLASLLNASFFAHAGLFSKLIREGAEGGAKLGGKTARRGLDAPDGPKAHIKKLPKSQGDRVLAAAATPEGHWRFVNRAGEAFTAANTQEIARAFSILLGRSADAGQGKVALYLTKETVFEQRRFIADLPAGLDLHVVMDAKSFPLRFRGPVKDGKLFTKVRPHVDVELSSQKFADEALWQLGRQLRRADIRLLSLQAGGPRKLSRVAMIDPATKKPKIDQIDAFALAKSMDALRGQTALVVGHIEGKFLHFKPTGKSERSLLLDDLYKAAADNDVNLIVLRSATPRQPGGRNWLFQKISVAGLDDALQRSTVADFLDALGAEQSGLTVAIESAGANRALFRVHPGGSDPDGGTGSAIVDAMSDIATSLIGNVAMVGMEASLRSKERQTELDLRFIPHIPSILQFAYLGSIVVGLMGWHAASSWWRRIWPPEARTEYSGRLGYWAARVARVLAFLFVYLPIVAIPAFIVSTLMQVWGWLTLFAKIVTYPFRWLWSRRRDQGASA